METKSKIFKRLLNNPKYTGEILQAINNHNFDKGVLKIQLEGETIELEQVGNNIKVKK